MMYELEARLEIIHSHVDRCTLDFIYWRRKTLIGLIRGV